MSELPRYIHLKRKTTHRVLGKGLVLTDYQLADMEEICIFHGSSIEDFLICPLKGLENYNGYVILKGKVQSSIPLKYGDIVVVYESEKDESLWVRPTVEFEDGRFEKLNPLT